MRSPISQHWCLRKEFIKKKKILPYRSAGLPPGPACPLLSHMAAWLWGAARAFASPLSAGLFARSPARSSGLRPQTQAAWGAARCLPALVRIINACVATGLSRAGAVLGLSVPCAGTDGCAALTEHRYSGLKSLIPLSLLRCMTKRETRGYITFLHPFRLH